MSDYKKTMYVRLSHLRDRLDRNPILSRLARIPIYTSLETRGFNALRAFRWEDFPPDLLQWDNFVQELDKPDGGVFASGRQIGPTVIAALREFIRRDPIFPVPAPEARPYEPCGYTPRSSNQPSGEKYGYA